MYLTMDLETDEPIITPRRSGLLARLLGIKFEVGDDLKELGEAEE